MRRLALAAALAAAGCGGGSGQVITGSDLAGDRSGTEVDAAGDAGADEALLPDLPAEAEVAADLAAEESAGCLPGKGCFGDGCVDNEDCLFGWCVEHMGEGICTQTCEEECPAGWKCKLLSGSGADNVWVCLSDFANLCRPCATMADCKGMGGQDDACIPYGTEGSFCGGSCGNGKECPWGFACKEVKSIDGVVLTQCVAEAGVCPCTKKSVALGLTTPCRVENEWGKCEGKRVCGAGGLSACDAAVPAMEQCNAADDDCDGETDEPGYVDGKLADLCDDGNECTVDLCEGEEGCSHVPLSEGECKDGDACTAGDHCEAGECVGLPTVCNDGDPCTDDTCTGLGGCAAEFNHAACDDGDPCTVADGCKQGECVGFPVDCQCLIDDDCAGLEDGDVCNGVLECDTGKLPHQCVIVAGSVVVCPEPQGKNAPCLAPACDPENGDCSSAPAHEGFACDDGDACTIGDACATGVCQPGVKQVCNDGNICTEDLCLPALGCMFDPVEDIKNDPLEVPCDDGNDCTVGDYCSGGKCQAAGMLDCDDGDPCTSDVCSVKGGCAHLIVAGPCDDGDPCTLNDQCINGKCQPGPEAACDDGNVCTDDACIGNGQCLHQPNAAGCNDGNACTEGDHCAGGACAWDALADCDDGNLCTSDYCDPDKGCTHKVNSLPCDDGNVCTTGDHCQLGACVPAGTLSCNDANACTDDGCKPEAGCSFVPNSAACSDGNACTVGDKCQLGWCKAGPALDCDDAKLCTTDSCDPLAGCKHENNTLPCDDGSLCSVADACSAGACKPGPTLQCDDASACTADSCDPATGCVHTPLAGACDDGNACTTADACLNGKCAGGPPPACNDGNVCTNDSCAPATGCVFTPNASVCSDNNACTQTDVCAGGQCIPGQAIDCNDANPCTKDQCVPATGCTYENLPDNTSCGGTNICLGGVCSQCGAHGTQTLGYTGAGQTFKVPDCITSVALDVNGAAGGNGSTGAGAQGGRVQATLAVTPGQTLYIYVGGAGGTGNGSPGGWNGGGTGMSSGACYGGGGGGGASDVRQGGSSLNDRVLVAGGGGGGGANGNNCGAFHGGAGGGPVGADGEGGGGCSGSGKGGTQSAGGAAGAWACSNCNATAGSFGQGGNGDTVSSCGGTTGGGGGGAGWYGGGGGGLGAGGGGSSYAGNGTSGVTHTQGSQAGNGKVVITW